MEERRRLMMSSNKKFWIFESGSGEITNASKSPTLYQSGTSTDFLYVSAYVARDLITYEPVQGYGYLIIPVDITKYKRLCFEVSADSTSYNPTGGAVGCSPKYSGNTYTPVKPRYYVDIAPGTGRRIVKIDISDKTGVYDVAATITSVKTQPERVLYALRLYNIWLE